MRAVCRTCASMPMDVLHASGTCPQCGLSAVEVAQYKAAYQQTIGPSRKRLQRRLSHTLALLVVLGYGVSLALAPHPDDFLPVVVYTTVMVLAVQLAYVGTEQVFASLDPLHEPVTPLRKSLFNVAVVTTVVFALTAIGYYDWFTP